MFSTEYPDRQSCLLIQEHIFNLILLWNYDYCFVTFILLVKDTYFLENIIICTPINTSRYLYFSAFLKIVWLLLKQPAFQDQFLISGLPAVPGLSIATDKAASNRLWLKTCVQEWLGTSTNTDQTSFDLELLQCGKKEGVVNLADLFGFMG